MFQWWCYPHRTITGRRREWVTAELAALYSHAAASLWVSHISWDHFLTTVQLTTFDHRGASIWYCFFLCYIVCRILTLWPGMEVVPPEWEAQKHNHWASKTAGHPGKSWCLHLRSSVVSSNQALAPPSPGGPTWSTPATPSKLRPHPINTTEVTLSFDVYLLSAYLSGWHGHFWRQNKPFFNLKTVSTVLDSYGHIQNTGLVTFSYCHSCICGNWIPLPGDSQLFCSWFYLLISDDSLFIYNWGAHLVQREQSPSN